MRWGWPLRRLAAPARAWQEGRALRPPARRSFRQLWREREG